MPENLNGEFKCPVKEDWYQFTQEVGTTWEQISKIHENTTQIKEEFRYLKSIDATLALLSDKLVGSATGRRQIPLDVALVLLVLFGAYQIISLVKDTNKDIKLNWTDGLSITEGVKKQIIQEPIKKEQ